MSDALHPLHVTAHLATAADLPDPFLLDGPLFAAAVAVEARRQGVRPSDLPRLRGQDILPLAIVGPGRHWFARCSDAYDGAGTVEWWCVGDRERVQALLDLIPAIGRGIPEGNGQVERWVVEAAAEDWSLRAEDGSLARHLPLSGKWPGRWVDRGQLVVTERAVQQPNPPYWTQHAESMCAVDGYWTGDYRP